MSGAAAVAAALRDIQASPLRPSSRPPGTTNSSPGVQSAGCCFAMAKQASASSRLGLLVLVQLRRLAGYAGAPAFRA